MGKPLEGNLTSFSILHYQEPLNASRRSNQNRFGVQSTNYFHTLIEITYDAIILYFHYILNHYLISQKLFTHYCNQRMYEIRKMFVELYFEFYFVFTINLINL